MRTGGSRMQVGSVTMPYHACEFACGCGRIFYGTALPPCPVYGHAMEPTSIQCSVPIPRSTDRILRSRVDASIWLEDIGVTPRFVVHEHDTKLSKKFREFWKEQTGARRIRIPFKAPKANAMTETWSEGCKRECLDFFMCCGFDRLDYIKTTWARYCNTRRPHRGFGMNNVVLDKTFQPETEGAICCRQELGGSIESCHKDTA